MISDIMVNDKNVTERKIQKGGRKKSDSHSDSKTSQVPLIISTAELLDESLFFVSKRKIDVRAAKALIALIEVPDKGMWRKQLAEVIGTKQRDGAFNKLLEKLEEVGYIERKYEKDEVYIKLTNPDGFIRANTILNVIQLEVLTRLEEYSDDLKIELLKTLKAIVEAKEKLEELGYIRGSETSKMLNGYSSMYQERNIPQQRR